MFRRIAPVLVVVSVFTPSPGGSGTAGPPAQVRRPALPVAFEANGGQLNPRVRFLARARGYDLFLTRRGPVFSLVREDVGAAVRMALQGADAVAPQPLDPLPGTVNYLLGDDPAGWRTAIPTYAGVRYADIQPGVDLLFRSGREGVPEYEIRLAPGVDPAGIRLTFSGVRSLLVDPGGALLLETAAGRLVHGRPIAYQPGTSGPRPVSASYMLNDGIVGFELGTVDPALPLVIDPPVTVSWSTFLGGGGSDEAWTATVNDDGAIYVTGQAGSTPPVFPVTPGAYDTSIGGTSDAFVAKLTPGGDALSFSTFLGGDGYDFGRGIAVDKDGSVYVAGGTGDPGGGAEFPTTPGAIQTARAGDADGFVVKLNPAGAGLVYSTLLGGDASDQVNDLEVDASGSAYVGGQTFDGAAVDFPTTPGAFDTSPGGGDGFATKLSPAGSTLVYSTFVGGSGFDLVNGIAVDGSGAAYAAGQGDDGFLTTPGAFDTSYNGNSEAFATKIAPGGGSIAYSTYLGGSGDDYADDVDVDVTGVAHVSGATQPGATPFPTTPGAFDTSLAGPADAFLTRVAPDGATLLYSTFLGGDGYDEAYAVAADGAGASHVAGDTGPGATIPFPTTPGAFDTSHNGGGDAFAAMVDPSGALAYSTFLGGSGGDEALGVGVTPSGAAVVVGDAEDAATPFPTTPGAFDSSHNGTADAFVVAFTTPYECQGRPVTRLGSLVNDKLGGTTGPDVVLALGGKDIIRTRGGADRVCAGDQHDTVNGGSGKDRLLGQLGRDRLKGGGGNDRLNGGKGKDVCSGGGGTDKGPSCEKERGIP